MKTKVLVPIATGFEEIETAVIVDVLRRVEVNVILASIQSSLNVIGSRKIEFVANRLLVDCAHDNYDAIVLPGGMPGAVNLNQCEILIDRLKLQKASGKWIGAICAAPAVVLQERGLILDIKATCYPGMGDAFDQYVSAPVVVDQNIVTSQGPGTALLFAIKLVEILCGEKQAKTISESMLVD